MNRLNDIQRTRLELTVTDRPDHDTERLQRATQFVFDVNELAIEEPQVAQKCAEMLAFSTLHTDLTEPANPDYVSNSACFVSIRFIALC